MIDITLKSAMANTTTPTPRYAIYACHSFAAPACALAFRRAFIFATPRYAMPLAFSLRLRRRFATRRLGWRLMLAALSPPSLRRLSISDATVACLMLCRRE